MNARNANACPRADRVDAGQRLMVSGWMELAESAGEAVELRRGMPVYTREGREAGKVAALVISGQGERAAFFLLCRLPEQCGYWLVAPGQVAAARDGAAYLAIGADELPSLPDWRQYRQD